MPPSAPVALVELLLLPCRFCSAVVTRELMAEVAAADAVEADDAAVFWALVLLAARLVSNLLNAELKLVSTAVEGVPEPSSVLNTALFADWSIRVVKADTVDATELTVVCVGALVEMLAETCVGALILAASVDDVSAALYSAARLADCDDDEIELIDITYPTRWLACTRYRPGSVNLEPPPPDHAAVETRGSPDGPRELSE
jgi:hypothetical protein